MNNKFELIINRISDEFDDIELPSYSTEGSSGMDIRAALKEQIVLSAGSFSLIPTNLKFEIPKGFEIQVRPRSGLAAKHGIGIMNSPGTIDEDYRGEVKVILFNFGKDDVVIQRGERIAQLVLSKVYKAEIIESDNLSITSRGEGGFGHTGKQ